MLNNNLETLEVVANILQVANYFENVQQTSNDKIMLKLEHQDKDYLEKLMAKLDLILEILTKEKEK